MTRVAGRSQAGRPWFNAGDGPIEVDAAPDPGAVTIPPASLRLPLRQPDVATPPPPPGLEVEPGVEFDPDPPELDLEYDAELKFANLPLLHLPAEERHDLRLRRLVQLGERQADAAEASAKSQADQLRLLQGWQTGVQERAGELIHTGQESCFHLVRVVISHPKFPAALATGLGTVLGGGTAGSFIWGYLVPWLWP